MKNIYKLDEERFPLFVHDDSNYHPYLLIDKVNKEVWADTRPIASYSPDEWEGNIARVDISRYFITSEEVNEFINSVLDLAEEYTAAEDSYEEECIAQEISEISWQKTIENVICTSFADYIEACNLGQKDVLEEIAESGNISSYVEDLLSNPNSIYFLDSVDDEKMTNDIIEFIK